MKQMITWGALALAASSHGSGGEVRIEEPPNDVIVTAEDLLVSGIAVIEGAAGPGPGPGPGPMLTLEINDGVMSEIINMTVPEEGRWTQPITLQEGRIYVLKVNSGDQSHSIVVTRGLGLNAQPRQKVAFEWQVGVDAEIEAIALGTLDLDLAPRDLQTFVARVKEQTVTGFEDAFIDIGIELVDEPGDDVHVIRMQASVGDIFGRSPLDPGNTDPQEISEVWVGTYRALMVAHFKEGDVQEGLWKPMAKGDELQERIDDVSAALARTAAHELGHSLGLVANRGRFKWMLGCDGGHNCESVDRDYEEAGVDRFNNGRYIMDPGGSTLNRARLALPAGDRSPRRTPATFNSFNRSYFSIVQP